MSLFARTVPSWVTDGWYSNNPFAQQLAATRFHLPVTTAAERAAVQEFKQATPAPTMGCASCGKFAFTRPRICFWCDAAMANTGRA